MSVTVRLARVVICYPHLWEKHAAVEGSEEKYSAEFLFKPNTENHQALRAAFLKELENAGKSAGAAHIHPPYYSGEEINARRLGKGLEPRQEVQGMLSVVAKDANIPPTVVNQQARPIPADQSANIFSGCVVNAEIDIFWSLGGGNPGVYCGLRGVQLVDNQNVEPIAGTRQPVRFEAIEGAPQPQSSMPSNVGPAPAPDNLPWD